MSMLCRGTATANSATPTAGPGETVVLDRANCQIEGEADRP